MMNIFSYLIEFTIMLIVSTTFFGMLAGGLWLINRQLMIRTLMWLGGSMIIIQFVGYAIWKLIIENRFVQEIDSWIPILTFWPIHFNPISEGLITTFHEPLSPLFTTGQIALLYDGLILLLIVIGTVLPIIYLAHQEKNNKLTILVTAFWFLIAQICWIGVVSILSIFWV